MAQTSREFIDDIYICQMPAWRCYDVSIMCIYLGSMYSFSTIHILHHWCQYLALMMGIVCISTAGHSYRIRPDCEECVQLEWLMVTLWLATPFGWNCLQNQQFLQIFSLRLQLSSMVWIFSLCVWWPICYLPTSISLLFTLSKEALSAAFGEYTHSLCRAGVGIQ